MQQDPYFDIIEKHTLSCGFEVKMLVNYNNLYLYIDDDLVVNHFDYEYNENILNLGEIEDLLSEDWVDLKRYLSLVLDVYKNNGFCELYDLVQFCCKNSISESDKLKLIQKLDSLIKSEDYFDNMRLIWDFSDTTQLSIYNASYERGCCGFSGETYFFKGHEYKFGFNFGH